VLTYDLAGIIRQSLDEEVARRARGPGIITQREAQQVIRCACILTRLPTSSLNEWLNKLRNMV